MLQDADATLRAVVAETVPKGTVIDLATPDQTWRDSVGAGPAVNAYLVRLAEDVQSRSAHWMTVYDDEDRAVGRREPVRRIRIHYVLTAWGAGIEDEHALLGAVLRGLISVGTVPARCLSGSLDGLGDLVTLDVAHPELAAFPWEGWSALGLPPRANLDVVLTVPLVPVLDRGVARRPDAIELGMANRVPAPASARRSGGPRGRITEGR